MINKQRQFLLYLFILLAVACAPKMDETVRPTTEPVSQPAAPNTPTDSIKPEPSATVTMDTMATDADETTATTEPVEQQPSTDLPLIMNRGAPANERCVVTNPQALEGVVNVYAAPDLQSTLVAQMGNWADVIQIEDGWYKILIPQGGTGWVQVEQVTLGGDCSAK